MTTGVRVAGVEWLPWGAAPFLRARTEAKPLLVAIVAPWSEGCREMDRVTYGDPDVTAAINAGCIPVRVDADHRPDIADRYDLGALPTTAFLDCEGRLLGGGTFVPPHRLLAALLRVTSAALPTGSGPHVDVAPHDCGPIDDDTLIDRVFSAFDDDHAGFGAAPKFPHAAPVRLALDLHAEPGKAALLDCAVRTLDAMAWGPLYDDQLGGFFRCAPAADWSGAPPEKLLATNAALLDLYVHAGTRLGHERWFARAVDIVDFINRSCAASNGAWRVSSCAEAARQFSDSNAWTASAMLHAAAVFQDEALGTRALDALERVLLSSYRPGHGVAHSAAGARGLLTDQVAMAAASLDAWESTGNIVYRMMAEELVHYALRTMWDQDGGGFFDRATDAPDEPVVAGPAAKPFVLNCDAAIVMRRLADAVNDRAFADRAQEALAAVAGRAASFGPLAAHYLLARRAVLR